VLDEGARRRTLYFLFSSRMMNFVAFVSDVRASLRLLLLLLGQRVLRVDR